MVKVVFSVPEDLAAYVSKTAKVRGQSEPSLWREIATLGARVVQGQLQIEDRSKQELTDLLELIMRSSIQTLTITRRLAGHVDEQLVVDGRADAIAIIEERGALG